MTFDLDTFWNDERDTHLDVTQKTFATQKDTFARLLDACEDAVNTGNKIIFFGNGGSAADAQHLATELTVRFINDRKPIPGLALTTDTSALTAAGNDYGFEFIFSRQIDALANDGDIVIALSTSGNSENIINALKSAKEKNCTTIGLSGKDGGKMPALCDHIIIVPSQSTARIQEMHITIGHMLCSALEQKLDLV